MLRCSVVATAAAHAVGCGEAITLEIASERPVPAAIDAICVGIADASSTGGHFGRHYQLEGKLATLPQTLRVEPGNASEALAWVRGDRGGVPALHLSSRIDFGDDVTLTFPKCQVGRAAAPSPVGNPAGPAAAARLAVSQGQGGPIVVAVAANAAALLAAVDGTLAARDAPPAPGGTPLAVIPIDIDGDCDDDIAIATSGAAPTIWKRERAGFTLADQVGTSTASALAAVDVERDGDMDLVVGGAGTLQLWLNSGGGTFTHAPGALAASGRVSAISALATGDVNADGHADLVVGQAGPPLVAWLGTGGRFEPNDAVVPPVALDVASLTLADADGDFNPDLAVAIRNAPMRLYIGRGGLLEDQSFLRIPQPIPTARAIAIGGWDIGCEPDAIVAAEAGAPTLAGAPGKFVADTAAPGATDVVMTDIDTDGDLDAILSTPEGARWLAR